MSIRGKDKKDKKDKNAKRLKWLRSRGYELGIPAAEPCRVCEYNRANRWCGRLFCGWCGAAVRAWRK